MEADQILDGLNDEQRRGRHLHHHAAVHPRRRRLGQDPGAHPPHRLPGPDRRPRPPPRPRPHLHPQGRGRAVESRCASSGCATASPPARSTRSPTPSSAPAGPTGASARPSCSSARSASSPGSLPPGSGRSSVLDVVTEIEWAKARALAPEDYPAEASRTPPPGPARLPRDGRASSTRYEDEKRAKRMVDFDDLLRLCRRDLLDDREFAQTQRWRFQHVFVDEFQDVNPLQRQLLEAWVGGRDDLCVVGDPNQAIYAWNGADPTALTGFLDRYPAGEVLRLTDNYRSSPQILAVANAVLAGGALDGRGGSSDARPRPRRRPCGPTGPTARSRRSGPSTTTRPRPGPSPGRSATTTARARAGRAQAVLCRTNAQTALIEQALHEAGIPFRVRGGGNLLDQPEIKAALRDLRRSTAATSPPPSPTSTWPPPAWPPAPSDLDRLRSGSTTATPARDRSTTTAPPTWPRWAAWPATSPPSTAGPTAAGFVAWLHDTTGRRAARRPRRRRRDRDLPRGQGPRVAGRPPGRARAGPGADRPRQGRGRRRPRSGGSSTSPSPAPSASCICTWAERRTFGERESHARPLAVPRRGRGRLPGARRRRRAGRLDHLPRGPAGHAARPHRHRPHGTGAPHAGTGVARPGRPTTAAARRRLRPRPARPGHVRRPEGVAHRPGPGRRRAAARHLPRPRAARGRRQPARRTSTTCWPCSGIGEVKVKRFGDAILGIVAEHGAS